LPQVKSPGRIVKTIEFPDAIFFGNPHVAGPERFDNRYNVTQASDSGGNLVLSPGMHCRRPGSLTSRSNFTRLLLQHAESAVMFTKYLRLKQGLVSREGTILILAAVLMVMMLGMVGFGVALGYVNLTRTQLQAAADSAAMASSSVLGRDDVSVLEVAQRYAGMHSAGGESVQLTEGDVESGTWDAASRSFSPLASGGNAIRITARRVDAPLFFARVLGRDRFTTSASAVSMANPRDIVFVVDLSGSMNDDSEPGWATNELTNEFSAQGYSTVATDLMQQIFTDFNYGTFPGTLQYVGAPLGVTANSSAYANLTKDNGPLASGSIPSTYRISNSNSEATRKQKAYKWMIDYQIASVMPNAKPTPNSSTNYNYWAKYLDYIIQSKSVSGRGTLPPSQDSDRIDGLNNPNSVSFPSASSSEPQSYRNKIGYRTYVQFMMDFGRNVRPDGSNYSPLSTSSPDCPWHNETVGSQTFSFPPREQPTHASRRALIAAIQVIKERNESIPDLTQRDWVSVVSFDVTSPGPVIHQTLTGDYDSAMTACTALQAVADNTYSTATETGLLTAKEHIKPSTEGGSGRKHAHKVVVLLTDGMPNLYTSNTSTINNYISDHPDDDFYSGSAYAYNAPLMQATSMQVMGWSVFPVGLGLGTDYSFMDRLARMGGTANDDGESPRGSGNPAQYEQRLADIFRQIITSPKSRLVQ
jgi:hypothetical protein